MTMNRTALKTIIFTMLLASGSSYTATAPNGRRVPFFVNVKGETSSSSSAAARAAPAQPQTVPPAVPTAAIKTEMDASSTASQDTPMNAQRQTPTTSPQKKGEVNAHGSSSGPFAPLVLFAKNVVGEDKLNKIRAKAIGLHSDVISNFVDTADSEAGERVLRALFHLADADKNGFVDEQELATALQRLGFSHLQQKQIAGIFARADADNSGALDYNEWKVEAPKTLRTNLIKLAKKNGGELGFLA